MSDQNQAQERPTIAMLLPMIDPTVVTPEEQTVVRNAIGDTPADEIVALAPYQLAIRIQQAQEGDKLSKEQPLTGHRLGEVATAIITHLKAMLGDNPQNTATAQPMTVRVEQPARYEDMDLRELLEALTAKPTALNRVLPHIKAQISRTISNTGGRWVVPLGTQHNGVNIDVAATVNYALSCNRPFTRPAARVTTANGQMMPISLDEALGMAVRPLKHPFTGEAIVGIDEEGYDISGLDPTFLEVITWARQSGHRLYPQVDYFDFMEEVFRSERSRRWTRITEDYEALKARGEIQDGLRFAQASQPGTGRAAQHLGRGFRQQSRTTDQSAFRGDQFGGSDVSDSPHGHQASAAANDPAVQGEYYKQLVQGVAQSRLSQTGSDGKFNGGVYHTVAITGSDNKFDGVVILGGGRIIGSDNKGNILLPPGGAQVTFIGSDNKVNQSYASWREIAELLRLT